MGRVCHVMETRRLRGGGGNRDRIYLSAALIEIIFHDSSAECSLPTRLKQLAVGLAP